jgi:monoamine oxidase
MSGGIGERIGAMDTDERMQLVAREMEKVHPGLLNHLEGGYAKVWHKDPWVGGAIALPSPGQMTSICVGIEKPEGRVHFAGEHTSRWTGWIQGALQSGLRAATEVCATSK